MSVLPEAITDARAGSDHRADHVALHRRFNSVFNVKDYGAIVDGTTDDSVAVQATHDAAKVVRGTLEFPDGVCKCAFIWDPDVSIKGDSENGTVLLGKPSTDVIRIDPALTETFLERSVVRDITIRVDDSVDAAASFPQRGGVGNAGIAVDYANGALAMTRRLANMTMENVKVESLSFVANGQNNSAGFYLQAGANLSRFRNVSFWRLKYGWWDHYPTSNLTSTEFANDHNHFDSIYSNYCDNGVRFVNHANSTITNLTIHDGSTGFQGIGVTSLIRANCANLTFDGVMIEGADTAWALGGAIHTVNNLHIAGASVTVTMTDSHSTYNNLGIHTTVTNDLTLTGSYNRLLGYVKLDSLTTEPTYTDSGAYNTVQTLFNLHVATDVIHLHAGSGAFRSTGSLYLDCAASGTLNLRNLGFASTVTIGTDGSLKHNTGFKLGLFGATPVVQPAANADTSGAVLADLETEVNQLKATLRTLGLIAT